jgi:hypothetical protein
MSAWDATPEELIAAGWGSHSRSSIPDDWKTRRGPDNSTMNSRQPRKTKQRMPFHVRRKLWETEQQMARLESAK